MKEERNTSAPDRALGFTCPNLLAPMEGVTEPCFRELVLEANAPEHLGGAFTEFARVSHGPIPVSTLSKHLGERRFAQPVGLQLMGSNVAAVAASARRAIEAGAPLVDLNFGCPAKGALRGCAGSAMLDDPSAVERLVSAVVEAVPDKPVTAKIRAGGEDDSLLEELARAVEQGGAWLLTVHCRTRRERYAPRADWSRLARAAGAVSIPVCGNGGIDVHADFERLRNETGCRYAMVGRAALGNPWIFSGRKVNSAEAAGFLVRYAEELLERRSSNLQAAAGRVKQLLRFWSVGGLVRSEEERRAWLRFQDPEGLLERLRGLAGGSVRLGCGVS